MKNFFILIFLFVLTGNLFAENEKDIRNAKWGMSKVEVIASEDMKPIRVTDDYISYSFDLMGEKTFLLYEFIKNSLLSARYVVEKSNSKINSKIKKILVLKYGEPIVEKDLFRWNKNGLIIHLETGDNYLKILYKSKKIEELKKRYEKKLNEKEKDYLLSIF